MLVKDYMTRHPIMIEPNRRVVDAQRLMAENKVSCLPVVGSGKRLLGMLTRERMTLRPEQVGSMDVWELTRLLNEMTVSRVMATGADLHTISPEAAVEEAADLMILHHTTALPVVDNGDVVVGIITETDLLIELRDLLGAIEPGWRAVVRVPNRQGEFRKILHAISERGWGLMAMGTVRSPKHPNHWDVIVKVRYAQRDDLVAALSAIEGQTLVDLRETHEPPAPTSS